jgi:hypothetical protein
MYPVMANSTVSAKEVDSQIFQSNESGPSFILL